MTACHVLPTYVACHQLVIVLYTMSLLGTTNKAPRKQDTTPNQLCSVYLATEEPHLTTSLGSEAERFCARNQMKCNVSAWCSPLLRSGKIVCLHPCCSMSRFLGSWFVDGSLQFHRNCSSTSIVDSRIKFSMSGNLHPAHSNLEGMKTSL